MNYTNSTNITKVVTTIDGNTFVVYPNETLIVAFEGDILSIQDYRKEIVHYGPR